MNNKNNPLSPHLQIYRWQISSLVSITHRITGILNLLGLIFICAWISSAGIGENFFESFSVFLKSFIGKFILIGFTWSMSYHLLSGIRHFFWDLGYGYEIKTANFSGIMVILSSLVLTIILWMIGKGLIFICAWISSAGIGENFFECFSVFLKSFIGKFILIGFTWSMSYHLLSGIRHFFWDLGYGYEIKTANLSGIIVIIGSLFLTIILWIIGKGLI